jgi:hypothetical protein
MCDGRGESGESRPLPDVNGEQCNSSAGRWRFWTFVALLSLDILGSVLLMLPILPW